MSEAKRFGELLGGRLRARRRELGLTEDDVARRCTFRFGLAFSRSVIDAIERGARDLTLPELAVVLAVLGCDLGDVLDSRDVVALTDFVAVRASAIVDQVAPARDATWSFATVSPATRKLVWRKDLSGRAPPIGAAERKAAAKLGVAPE